MTLKSWTVSQTDTRKRLGKISITRYVFSPMIFIVSAAWYLLVMVVLLPWLALDWLPKRRDPSHLTPPSPQRRKLPIPIREGSDIFVLNPDGTKIALDALEAKVQAEAWNNVVMGAFVFEKSRISQYSVN